MLANSSSKTLSVLCFVILMQKCVCFLFVGTLIEKKNYMKYDFGRLVNFVHLLKKRKKEEKNITCLVTLWSDTE